MEALVDEKKKSVCFNRIDSCHVANGTELR